MTHTRTVSRSYQSRPHAHLTPAPVVTFTLAARLLACGQRLREGEAITATTVALNYAAKWVQAAPAQRRQNAR